MGRSASDPEERLGERWTRGESNPPEERRSRRRVTRLGLDSEACAAKVGGASGRDNSIQLGAPRLSPYLLSTRHHVLCFQDALLRSTSASYRTASGDRPRDVVRIAPDAVDLLGRNRIQELETDEVEARL